MYDDIVIPTDGSPRVGRSVEEALNLAEEFDAAVHPIYVIDTRTFLEDSRFAGIMDKLEIMAEEATGEIAEKARERGLIAIEHVKEGRPYEEIVDYAEEKDADLIVMGSHGKKGLERIMLGSTTEKVLRTTDRPVLVTETGEGEE